MQKKQFKRLVLYLCIACLCGACTFLKDHLGRGSLARIKRAEHLYKRKEYEKAISLCTAVIDDGCPEVVARKAKLQLARTYFQTRQFEKTVSLYDELLFSPSPDILATDVSTYIDLLKSLGKVNKAKEISNLYANNYKNNTHFSNQREALDNYAVFSSRDTMQHAQVESLRTNIPGYQYGLAAYKDKVVFLNNEFKKADPRVFHTDSKLYVIDEDSVKLFSYGLRGPSHVGPASFFDKGEKVIYTTGRLADERKTQLLSSIYQPHHNSWSNPLPLNLGENMDSHSFLQPSVTADGQRLYFVSDMPGGFGGTDIYYADWDRTEKRWKAPVNMGPSVNTYGNELSPCIVGDKLFFSSDGLPGFGGQDIFMINIKQQEAGPIHLPYPVNTQYDDLNAVLNDTRQLLYFTSDRSEAHSNDRIYALDLKKSPMKQLGFPYPPEIKHVESKAVAVNEYHDTINSNPEMIPWQHDTNGHTSTALSLYGNSDSSNHITAGIIHIPGAVYFDLNSYVPQHKEWHKLDSILTMWKENPHRTIIINGHADVIGAERYNLLLSRNRAEYIRAYFRSKGVDKSKIQMNYFGSTRPAMVMGHYTFEMDRAAFIQEQGINRRCEVKLL